MNLLQYNKPSTKLHITNTLPDYIRMGIDYNTIILSTKSYLSRVYISPPSHLMFNHIAKHIHIWYALRSLSFSLSLTCLCKNEGNRIENDQNSKSYIHKYAHHISWLVFVLSHVHIHAQSIQISIYYLLEILFTLAFMQFPDHIKRYDKHHVLYSPPCAYSVLSAKIAVHRGKK